MSLSGRENLARRICSNLMHLDFNFNETFNKTCKNEKELFLSNGTTYVIHHKFQTTSRTRNLPIEQSIYSPECIHWESDVFRPNYDKSKNSTIFYIA